MSQTCKEPGGSGAGPPAQTCLSPDLPLPPFQTSMTPQWKPSTRLTQWTPPILPVDLPLKDTYCLREEIYLYFLSWE